MGVRHERTMANKSAIETSLPPESARFARDAAVVIDAPFKPDGNLMRETKARALEAVQAIRDAEAGAPKR